MKRLPPRWLGLAAAAAMLAAGCTAQPQNMDRLNQSNLFTTTGDADMCAAALGNTVNAATFWRGMAGANQNVTANGVIIGNVALVALPRESQNTPVTGARVDSPAGTTAAGTTATRDRDSLAAPDGAGRADARTRTGAGTTTGGGTGTAAGTPGLGTTRPAVGVTGGRVETGTPMPAGTTVNMRTGPATGTGAAARPGTMTGTRPPAQTGTTAEAGLDDRTVPAPGTWTGVTAAVDPLERVRAACPNVADIRVVNDENDRGRLAEITAAVRAGQPITEFMTDLATIAQRATSAGPGANARRTNLRDNRQDNLQSNIQRGSVLPGNVQPGATRQGNVQPGNVRQGNVVPGPTGTPVTPAPAGPQVPAPNAPGSDGRGSTPARAGVGTATDPGTSATD